MKTWKHEQCVLDVLDAHHVHESLLYDNDQRDGTAQDPECRWRTLRKSLKMLTSIHHTHPNTEIQTTLQKDNEKRLIQSSNSDTFNIRSCSIDNGTAKKKKLTKKTEKKPFQV